MMANKNKLTGLKGKSMMNTSAGKDVTKVKVKNSGVNMPATNKKVQGLKARTKK